MQLKRAAGLPLSLGFATPMGFWTAPVQLFRLGNHTLHNVAIRRLTAVDTLDFDKTGTLTAGTTQLLRLQVLPGLGLEVSFGIAQGAPLAVLAADFTLSQASLVHLPQAIAVARRARRLVRTNLGFAAAYNTLGMAAAAAGLVHPVGAAWLMLCASLTVTLRSMVFLQMPQVAAVPRT